ncbi:hypothetical protein VRU48_09935 [Pedobacter sp. KR3-3]|uniref:Uncharacterized protein n=1 Tax=Pedobacter albus TaxID=3113905 RepID=A0ABU7I7K2_9SPHI|nr:hypothetical protein [Pedobacter sp. KR3-3]MEE1945428.1 hypothetical protein [Pedobacter sp. KR3-3]
MIIKFLSTLLSSIVGIYLWVTILDFLTPVYDFNETFFGFLIYYGPLMFTLLVFTKCAIYIVRRFEAVKKFLKSETGLFLTLLGLMSLFIPLKAMIVNDYDFKVSFLIAYLISMQLCFLSQKIANNYF